MTVLCHRFIAGSRCSKIKNNLLRRGILYVFTECAESHKKLNCSLYEETLVCLSCLTETRNSADFLAPEALTFEPMHERPREKF
jgi:hypothetical protein